MRAIGSGHYVLLELWNEGDLVHRGILPPGENYAGWFTGGAETVTKFVLKRLTKEEADAVPDETTEGAR